MTILLECCSSSEGNAFMMLWCTFLLYYEVFTYLSGNKWRWPQAGKLPIMHGPLHHCSFTSCHLYSLQHSLRFPGLLTRRHVLHCPHPAGTSVTVMGACSGSRSLKEPVHTKPLFLPPIPICPRLFKNLSSYDAFTEQ